jgi:Ni,Fe-hydrogenase III large subunit/Ni,Fe-hydrogenase III component G
VLEHEQERDWIQNLLLGIEWSLLPSPARNELYINVQVKDWVKVATRLVSKAPAYLTTMFANDERPITGYFVVYAVFAVQNRDLLIGVRLAVKETQAQFPSLTPHIPAAHWYEREIKDMFGLVPVDHPDPRRLVLHPFWPKRLHPLRKDFLPQTIVEPQQGKMAFTTVEGEGVFEVPVGPIHAGIIEPGHFRFSVIGEDVLHLEAKLFYTHRGIEKMCEGMDVQGILSIAERICGACSLSHATAYAQAIERIVGIKIPERAQTIRSLGLELERLYNHIGDIGNICAGVGFAFGNMQLSQLKEVVMALNERFVGNRFLHGVVALGGVNTDISLTMASDIGNTLAVIEKEFKEVTEILLDQPEFINRVENTGILQPEIAADLGVVGPVARAAGLDRDWRRDYPYADYAGKNFVVPVYQTGDVSARLRVRIDETLSSLDLISQFMETMPMGILRIEIETVPAYQYALGYVESPRGANVHWVMTGENNTVYRYMIRSASYPNWPSVALAVPGNIVPDFPLINKSYELCYACLDR